MPPLTPTPLAGGRPRTARRLAEAAAAIAALTAAVVVAGPAPAVWAGLIAPDLPLLAAIGGGYGPDRMNPRAVPFYNATHRLAGPLLLAAAGAATGTTPALAGALAWAAHILGDRAMGYRLRDRDGRIRPR